MPNTWPWLAYSRHVTPVTPQCISVMRWLWFDHDRCADAVALSWFPPATNQHHLYGCPRVYVMFCLRSWLIFKFHVFLRCEEWQEPQCREGGRLVAAGLWQSDGDQSEGAHWYEPVTHWSLFLSVSVVASTWRRKQRTDSVCHTNVSLCPMCVVLVLVFAITQVWEYYILRMRIWFTGITQ